MNDLISRKRVLKVIKELHVYGFATLDEDKVIETINKLPSVISKEKIGYCKECKWWKDNDGVYRRGIGAESKCPINCKKVYEGNGYCFMFEPQESENKE